MKSKSNSIEIEVHVSCAIYSTATNLYCEGLLQTVPNQLWAPLGETEIISDTPNPKWLTVIKSSYKFQTVQYIRFNIFEKETETDKRHIGQATLTMARLINTPQIELELKDIEGIQVVGVITLHAEEEITCKEKLLLVIRGSHLDDLDTFSKSDPFVIIYREHSGGD